MASLDELNSAARLKETIVDIATETFKVLNPEPRHGTVMTIDTSAGKVGVTYPDEAGVFTVKAQTIMPSVGAVVKVAGKMGSRYVDFQLSGGITLNAAVTITGALGAASLTVTGVATFSGGIASSVQLNREGGTHEGGQLAFQGGTSFANGLYIDRYGNDFRIVYNGTVVESLNADGTINASSFRVPDSSNNGVTNASNNSWIRPQDGGGNLHIKSNAGGIYLDGSSHFFRTAGGTNRLSLDGSGNLVASGGLQGVTLTLTGNGAINWPSHGGNIWMQDSSYIRFDKSFYNGGNTIANDGYLSIGNSGGIDGSWPVWLNRNTRCNQQLRVNGTATFTGEAVHENKTWSNYTGGTTPVDWQNQNWIMQGSPNVGMAFHVPAAFFAPYLRHYQGLGRIDCSDSGGGAYATFGAQSYFTASSIDIKKDVVEADDDELLQKAFWAKTTKYRLKQPEQGLRPTERFRDIDARWQAMGHSPLVAHVNPENLIVADHECSIDGCDGTTESPCRLGRRNAAGRVGPTAEDIFNLWPEAAAVDENGAPEGIYVEQLAGQAFGAVGALTRKLTEAFMRIEALEAELASR